MAKINIEYTRRELINLIIRDLQKIMPGTDFAEKDIHIEVKSAQNYKSEWETAEFRAKVTKL